MIWKKKASEPCNNLEVSVDWLLDQLWVESYKELQVELESSPLLFLPLPIQKLTDAQFGLQLAGSSKYVLVLPQYIMQLVVGVREKSDDYNVRVHLG